MSEDQRPQSQTFDDLARELDADGRFEETVRKIALKTTMTAECMHCGCTFPVTAGHVGDDATLCSICLHDD